MLMMSMTTYAQKTPEIYRIFDAQGKEVSYEKMIKTVSAQMLYSLEKSTIASLAIGWN